MSNDKMRDALVAARAGLVWYIESYPQAANGCDDEMLGQIDAALEHKPEVSQPVWFAVNTEYGVEFHLTYNQAKMRCEPDESPTKLYIVPPDYEELKAENAVTKKCLLQMQNASIDLVRQINERDLWVKELTVKTDFWYSETQTVKAENEALKLRISNFGKTIEEVQAKIDDGTAENEALKAENVQLQSECENLKKALFMTRPQYKNIRSQAK